MDDISGNGSWIGWDIGRAVFWSLLIYWLQLEVQNIFYSWLYILKESYFKLSINVSDHPTIHWQEAKMKRYVKLTLSTHQKYPPLIRYLNRISRNCWNLNQGSWDGLSPPSSGLLLKKSLRPASFVFRRPSPPQDDRPRPAIPDPYAERHNHDGYFRNIISY